MKKIIFSFFCVAQTAVLMSAVVPPAPVVMIPKKILTPVAPVTVAPVTVAPVVPKVVIPMTVVLPKVVAPVVTSAPPVVTPPAPVVPAVATPPVAAPATTPVIEPDQQNVVMTAIPIDIKNMSEHSGNVTGVKVVYASQEELNAPTKTQIFPIQNFLLVPKSAKVHAQGQILVPLPPKTYVQGFSDIFIDTVPVSVVYKGNPWSPATTPKLYITKKNGVWQLDKKMMDKDYKNPNAGVVSYSDWENQLDQDDKSKTVRADSTTDAVTTAFLKKEKSEIKKKVKKSKSGQVATRII